MQGDFRTKMNPKTLPKTIPKKHILMLNYEFPQFGEGKARSKEKAYKPFSLKKISSLRTVTIFPGDRKVAGCFYFLGGIF